MVELKINLFCNHCIFFLFLFCKPTQHVSPCHIVEAIRCQLARKSNATNSKRRRRRRRRLEVPPSRRRQLGQHPTKAPRALWGDRSKQDSFLPSGGETEASCLQRPRVSQRPHFQCLRFPLFFPPRNSKTWLPLNPNRTSPPDRGPARISKHHETPRKTRWEGDPATHPDPKVPHRSPAAASATALGLNRPAPCGSPRAPHPGAPTNLTSPRRHTGGRRAPLAMTRLPGAASQQLLRGRARSPGSPIAGAGCAELPTHLAEPGPASAEHAQCHWLAVQGVVAGFSRQQGSGGGAGGAGSAPGGAGRAVLAGAHPKARRTPHWQSSAHPP